MPSFFLYFLFLSYGRVVIIKYSYKKYICTVKNTWRTRLRYRCKKYCVHFSNLLKLRLQDEWTNILILTIDNNYLISLLKNQKKKIRKSANKFNYLRTQRWRTRLRYRCNKYCEHFVFGYKINEQIFLFWPDNYYSNIQSIVSRPQTKHT